MRDGVVCVGPSLAECGSRLTSRQRGRILPGSVDRNTCFPKEDARQSEGAALAALPQTNDVDAITEFLQYDFRAAALGFLDIEPQRDKDRRVV